MPPLKRNPIQSKRTIRNRILWLLVLFIVTGSLSYPAPANWLLAQAKSLIGINLGQIQKPFVLGLDLQGGTHLEYEADVSKQADADRKSALDGVRDVIERRVNTLGVSEPLIQTTQAGNAWRVTVELAGIRDINQAIKLIGETPILEFKEQNDQKTPVLTEEQKKEMDQTNVDANKRVDQILMQAKKPGTDFAALAKEKTENPALKESGGDLGFIKDKSEVSDIYSKAKDLPAGTVLPLPIERPHYLTIAKVEEVKDAGTQIHAKHVLISYKGARGDLSTYTKEEARAKIDKIKAQITQANFDKLVAENSQEPGAVESKGDLSWFGKGDMVDEFEKVVFVQKVGTISDVVETPFGFHIIWKLEERPVKDVHVRLIEIKKLTPEDLAPPVDPWKATALTGKQLQSARVEFDQRTGAIQIALQFNSEGGKLFADITKRNVGKSVAIFLDGQPISVPTVQNEILGGQAVITGSFNLNEAKLLAQRLQAGALPVAIKLIAQQTVGPTLGADSLQKSLKAGLIGFLLVALYMIALYRLPGVVSIVALLLYAAVSAAVFKMIPVTLSLSGIAGFILSLGIAVDANVLVFERLKEEWMEGKGLTLALEDAFKRAWLSIRDGHATVLISCAVLYWFSSSMIKGFALTLAIGTLISLFTAVVSSRTILRFLAGTPIAKNGWLFLKPRNKQE
ncbi:protein translocase subunit SecD [Candidatus Uhrbacteria bacterium]|nr:protein translocase subunit SecD [Candidatus Uhrbacteria bacterium]